MCVRKGGGEHSTDGERGCGKGVTFHRSYGASKQALLRLGVLVDISDYVSSGIVTLQPMWSMTKIGAKHQQEKISFNIEQN